MQDLGHLLVLIGAEVYQKAFESVLQALDLLLLITRIIAWIGQLLIAVSLCLTREAAVSSLFHGWKPIVTGTVLVVHVFGRYVLMRLGPVRHA